MSHRTICLSLLAGCLFATGASAQIFAPPRDFYNRTGVALYNPEIGVVNSGIRNVVQPTVSADRKYVTIAMQPQLSQVVRIENFPVAMLTGPVGGIAPAGGGPAAPPAANFNASTPTPIRAGRVAPEILDLPGMTWIAEP